jgi:hypothetical protein
LAGGAAAIAPALGNNMAAAPTNPIRITPRREIGLLNIIPMRLSSP